MGAKKKLPLGDKLLCAVAVGAVSAFVWPILKKTFTPQGRSELRQAVGIEVVDEDKLDPFEDDRFVVVSKEKNACTFYETQGLVIKGGDIIEAETTSDVAEDDFVGARVVCDRPPPLWVAAKAREVVVVGFALGKGVKRGEATVAQLALAAQEPQFFRAKQKGA